MKKILYQLLERFKAKHVTDHTIEGDVIQDVLMANEAIAVIDNISKEFGEWLLHNAEIKHIMTGDGDKVYWGIRGANDLKGLDGHEDGRYSTFEIYEHFKNSL